MGHSPAQALTYIQSAHAPFTCIQCVYVCFIVYAYVRCVYTVIIHLAVCILTFWYESQTCENAEKKTPVSLW